MRHSILPLVLLLGGCIGSDDGDDGDGSGSGSFGSLEGEWSVPVEVWAPYARDDKGPRPVCRVRLSGSKISADCEASGRIDDGGETLEYRYTVAGSGTLGERTIDLVVEYRLRRDYPDDPDDGGTCVLNFQGTASRSEGREVSGRFSPLAGVWDGDATWTTSCAGDSDRDGLRLKADILGSTARIEWTAIGESPEHIDVLDGPDGIAVGIEVDRRIQLDTHAFGFRTHLRFGWPIDAHWLADLDLGLDQFGDPVGKPTWFNQPLGRTVYLTLAAGLTWMP